jgi:LuxR family maltose regulon positive regulatory protein
LHHEAAAGGDLYLAVQLAIRLAEALGALEEETAARETLARSLELGASVGLYQSFVDGGPVIGRLLAVAAERERPFLQPYVGSLLDSWRSANQSVGTLKNLKLSGPLSPRECRILGLVRRGYSNKRVALELGIAPETVKSHAKHIFLKLGAQTRTEAVSRATGLGLI